VNEKNMTRVRPQAPKENIVSNTQYYTSAGNYRFPSSDELTLTTEQLTTIKPKLS
jgi:hypothetical protein